MRLSLTLALLAAAFFVPSAASAQSTPRSVRLYAGSARAADALPLLKGETLNLTARAFDAEGREVPGVTFTWASAAPANVSVTPTGAGATLRALRDALDEPARNEPRAVVSACVGEVCDSIAVTCLIDVRGTWNTHLAGSWRGIIAHSEDRVLQFVQNGRVITFVTDDRTITLRLDADRVRMTDGNGVLTSFSGRISSRSTAGGTFSSVPGFSGNWTARLSR